jgi:hypothetical protein
VRAHTFANSSYGRIGCSDILELGTSNGLPVQALIAVVREHNSVPLDSERPGSAAVLLGERPYRKSPQRHIHGFTAGVRRLPHENRGPAGGNHSFRLPPRFSRSHAGREKGSNEMDRFAYVPSFLWALLDRYETAVPGDGEPLDDLPCGGDGRRGDRRAPGPVRRAVAFSVAPAPGESIAAIGSQSTVEGSER